jgi:hypothetical protein
LDAHLTDQDPNPRPALNAERGFGRLGGIATRILAPTAHFVRPRTEGAHKMRSAHTTRVESTMDRPTRGSRSSLQQMRGLASTCELATSSIVDCSLDQPGAAFDPDLRPRLPASCIAPVRRAGRLASQDKQQYADLARPGPARPSPLGRACARLRRRGAAAHVIAGFRAVGRSTRSATTIR